MLLSIALVSCLSMLAPVNDPAIERAPTRTGAEDELQVSPASPREAAAAFVAACHARSFATAAHFLDLRGESEPEERAEQLCAVVDERAWIDLDELSPASTGELDDGLPRNVELVATIRRDDGEEDPLRMVAQRGRDPAWKFERAVTRRIDEWYQELDDLWLREHLPELLLRMGPRGLFWWQWALLPGVIAVAWAIGSLLARLLVRLARRTIARASPQLDTDWLLRMRAPITLLAAFATTWAATPWMRLGLRGQGFVDRVLHASLLFAVFWLLARALDFAGELASRSDWALHRAGARSLIPLARRIGKVVVFAMAVVAFLAELGYPIASLLAGLGIGGLAIALAAQKTVENLFGAFSIGADAPFREGDFVRVGDLMGTVEMIGLRSTRLRTLDRTLVTIPNGRLADMQLESFAARDRLRLHLVLQLVYETTVAQLRDVVGRVETALQEHAKIVQSLTAVHVVAFGESSIDVEINAWFETTSWDEFLDIRQDMHLEIATIVASAGSAFAFPTRTVHHVDDSPE